MDKFIRFLPDIIGKSGSNIRAIQERTTCRVIIPQSASGQSNPNGSDAPVKISLAGPRDAVALAKQIIGAITEFYHHPVTHPDVVHVLVDVPDKYYNVIIGSKGSEIRHIQNNFKVSVKIPNETTVFRSVLVIGVARACELAKNYIEKLVETTVAKEELRTSDKWDADNDEDPVDEDLSQYIYSRNKAPVAAAPLVEPPVVSETIPRPISERPPGFSPMPGAVDGVDATAAPAVKLAWGPAKQNW